MTSAPDSGDDRPHVPGTAEGDKADADGSQAYDWYTRGQTLYADGHPGAAASLFDRALGADPTNTSLAEASARAHFDAGGYESARDRFASLVEVRPDDDYAHFGLGLSLWRLGFFSAAVEHLAMAAVMRPEREDYRSRLASLRATLRARAEAGLPADLADERGPATGGGA